MESIRITESTLPQIESAITLAYESKKDYKVEIKLHDNSLKARQRALAVIWYKEIASQRGELARESEAFCKYNYGFRIVCENNRELNKIIRRMLDPYDYEEKLEIIAINSKWFPVLRNDGGMGVEQQGRYLSDIQRAMGREGVFLTSTNEKELLNYPEARR